MKQIIMLLFPALLIGSSVKSQCHYIQATTTSVDTIVYTWSGGSFSSFGCAPIDPTYWLSGSGKTITATFVTPQDYPVFRVWGMNSDDSATVAVNGNLYNLDYTTATYNQKVVCGLSPGPYGIAFHNGKFYGVNTPVAGNYSYQDIQLFAMGVNSITVTGVSGAGWGFAGVMVSCALFSGVDALSSEIFNIYPNPVYGISTLSFNSYVDNARIVITNMQGAEVMSVSGFSGKELELDLRRFVAGIYFIKVAGIDHANAVKKILVTDNAR